VFCFVFFSPQKQSGPKPFASVEQKLVWPVKGCRTQATRERRFTTSKHNSLALCWQNTDPNKDQLSCGIFRRLAFYHTNAVHRHIVINLKISAPCHMSISSVHVREKRKKRTSLCSPWNELLFNSDSLYSSMPIILLLFPIQELSA